MIHLATEGLNEKCFVCAGLCVYRIHGGYLPWVAMLVYEKRLAILFKVRVVLVFKAQKPTFAVWIFV